MMTCPKGTSIRRVFWAALTLNHLQGGFRFLEAAYLKKKNLLKKSMFTQSCCQKAPFHMDTLKT